jgi:signal peptidase I
VPLLLQVDMIMVIAPLAPRALAVLDAAFVRHYRPPSGNQIVFALALGAGALVLVAYLGQRHYVEGFVMPQSGMSPTVMAGDSVFVSKFEYRIDDIARGDVVGFRHPCAPDRVYIQRAIALGGDTVEVRCGVVHVNGQAVPRRVLDERAVYWRESDTQHWQTVATIRYAELLDGRTIEVFDRSTQANETDPDGFPGQTPPSCTDDAAASAPPALGKIVASAAPTTACAPHRHYVVPDGHIFVMGDNRDQSSDSRTWGPVPTASVLGKAIGLFWSKGPPAEGIRWDRLGPIE